MAPKFIVTPSGTKGSMKVSRVDGGHTRRVFVSRSADQEVALHSCADWLRWIASGEARRSQQDVAAAIDALRILDEQLNKMFLDRVVMFRNAYREQSVDAAHDQALLEQRRRAARENILRATDCKVGDQVMVLHPFYRRMVEAIVRWAPLKVDDREWCPMLTVELADGQRECISIAHVRSLELHAAVERAHVEALAEDRMWTATHAAGYNEREQRAAAARDARLLGQDEATRYFAAASWDEVPDYDLTTAIANTRFYLTRERQQFHREGLERKLAVLLAEQERRSALRCACGIVTSDGQACGECAQASGEARQ